MVAGRGFLRETQSTMTKATRKSHSTTHISSRIFFTIFREFLRFFYASWRLGTKVHPWTTILGKVGYKSTPGTPILVDPWDPKLAKIHTRPYGGLSGVLTPPTVNRFSCGSRTQAWVHIHIAKHREPLLHMRASNVHSRLSFSGTRGALGGSFSHLLG